MASTPLRRPLNGPRRRTDEVIEAAAAVFAEQGYHGASTQDIADRLGMRQASLYYYFPSKEAALEAVCLRGGEGYVEHALAAANGSGSAIDKLGAILRSHLRAMGENPAFSRAFLRERRFLPQEARRRIGRVARRYERIIESVLEAGIECGELRNDLDPRLAMLGLLGMANAAVDWHDRKPGLTIERIADGFVRLAVDGIAARQGAG
jgi:TetR/AcrR family transcriptional regulator, cholesterol catabolism regulator